MRFARLLLAFGAAACMACAPAARTDAAAPTATVAQVCDGVAPNAADSLPLYASSRITAVEPLYVKRPAGKLTYERLGGASISLQTPVGSMSEGDLQRALECHAARAANGSVSPEARPNDPLVPATGRALVRVAAIPRGFEVRIEGDSREAAHDIYARAKALAPNAVAVAED